MPPIWGQTIGFQEIAPAQSSLYKSAHLFGVGTTLLQSLFIRNYTLVEQLEIDFQAGATAITGETGAGKSLVLDALAMALGDRADSDTIRHGEDRAEITASFDISALPEAQAWLRSQDYDSDQCILRRIYTLEGRSRGYINGMPCTMQQLRELGEMLVDIHSQHEHQSLLRRDTHCRLLDEFAGTIALAAEVTQSYRSWRTLRDKTEQLRNNAAELAARRDLLSFQLGELRDLALDSSAFEALEQEQQALANADQIVHDSQQLLAICDQGDEFNINAGLHRALSLLHGLKHKPQALENAEELINSSVINMEEAVREIEAHLHSFEANPQRLEEVDSQLSELYQLARKHRVEPAELKARLAELDSEWQQLDSDDNNLDALEQQLSVKAQVYHQLADKLSVQRRNAGKAMAAEINQQLQQLSMQGAELCVALNAAERSEPGSNGNETVEFLIATNPGQPHKPLQKIASGGELSRVSLAIQVIAAAHSSIPTLIFDEVDVGIGDGR